MGLFASILPIAGNLLGGLFGGSSASRAGKAIANANIAAEHGVLGATSDAQTNIANTLANNATNVNNAGQSAIDQVNGASGNANTTLSDTLSNINANSAGVQQNLNPYLAGGAQGVNSLAAYAASNPQFEFDPSKYLNSDAMKFDIAQGSDAIQNSAAARGLAVGGNTLKDLTSFAQGTASKYYDQAFQQAQNQFQTNQNATLSNLSTLINSGLGASSLLNSNLNSLNSLTANLGGQQAQNTFNAGLFGGGTTTDLAKFLASQGLAGNEFSGELGLKGATTAGNFATGAAQGTAAGILGQGGSLLGGLGGILNSLPGLLQALQHGGGGGFEVGDSMGG